MFGCIRDKFTLAGCKGQRRGSQALFLMGLVSALVACTPTFNWREVAFDTAPLKALLPCKPDRGERQVQLGGQTLTMQMAGCEAGGAMFTVSWVRVSAPESASAVVADWKRLGQATHSKEIVSGRVIAQAAVYGQPKELGGGSAASQSQVVETFLSQLQVADSR